MKHRTYAAVCHGPFAGLDYLRPRPFQSWASGHLNTLIGGWLQLDPPCLELATLAHEELLTRREELAAAMKFADVDLTPIPWLSAARKAVAEKFPPTPDEPKGRGNVYVILRGGYTQQSGWYGAYVGSTTKTVARRYMEHRSGKRAARGLPTHGIEPLYSLFVGLNPVGGGKKRLLEAETQLHETLAPVVAKVTGDVAY